MYFGIKMREQIKFCVIVFKRLMESILEPSVVA